MEKTWTVLYHELCMETDRMINEVYSFMDFPALWQGAQSPEELQAMVVARHPSKRPPGEFPATVYEEPLLRRLLMIRLPEPDREDIPCCAAFFVAARYEQGKWRFSAVYALEQNADGFVGIFGGYDRFMCYRLTKGRRTLEENAEALWERLYPGCPMPSGKVVKGAENDGDAG